MDPYGANEVLVVVAYGNDDGTAYYCRRALAGFTAKQAIARLEGERSDALPASMRDFISPPYILNSAEMVTEKLDAYTLERGDVLILDDPKPEGYQG